MTEKNSRNTSLKGKTTAQERIKMSHLKLDSLLEITKAINANASKRQLFSLFEDILKNELNIGKLAVYTFDEVWTLEICYGLSAPPKIDVYKEVEKFKDITNVSNDENYKPFDVVIPVTHKTKSLAYALIGDIDEDRIEISPTIKHLPFIQTLANIIVVAIENKILAKEGLRQEGLRKELELASEMQAMLFPASLPNDKFLEIDAMYLPHHQVGGDYYDFITLNDNEVAFCMADVSGKGMSAALLMANFQANLRALISHSHSLTEVIVELNNKVNASAKGEKYITLFLAKYNKTTRVLTYINAAHIPPVFFANKTLSLLKTGCTGIGMFDELPSVHEGIIAVPENSSLICYTDGAIEIENNYHEEFGLERLKDLVTLNAYKPMKEVNEAIIIEIDRYKDRQPYWDDIALFSCRMH